MPSISQKTKLLELLTGSILSDILYLHILYGCNSSMFTSDQSYLLTFSREERQLWFSAIKQNFQQPRGYYTLYYLVYIQICLHIKVWKP